MTPKVAVQPPYIHTEQCHTHIITHIFRTNHYKFSKYQKVTSNDWIKKAKCSERKINKTASEKMQSKEENGRELWGQ